MKSSIGETLKKCRLETKKSVKEISDLLISKGFKASEKTIYSWENGNSQPSPDALLIMCKAYGISDVLGTFGYGLPSTSRPNTLAAHFDSDEYTDDELAEIHHFAEFVKTKRPNSPELAAAHVRADITPTPEGQAHDNAIMDDDSEWE